MVEPDRESPLSQTPPSPSIDTVTLSAPTTVHETVTDGGGPAKLESGAVHADGFDTEKLVMISGEGVVAGDVLAVTGFAVVAGAVAGAVAGVVAADAAVVVVAPPATVVVDDDVVVVESVPVDVFDVELQPTINAPVTTADRRSLREDIMAAL